MELIFENVEERDEFFLYSSACPSKCGGRDNCILSCSECWKQSGVKYRVKETYSKDNVSQRFARIKELYDSVYNGLDFDASEYEWILGEGIINHIEDSGFKYRSYGQKYKTLMGISIAVDYDYPLKVSLCKILKQHTKNQPTPDHPVSIEEQKKTGLFATFEALNTGDALVKIGGGWRIERKLEEPKKQVYISTASHPDPLFERMLKNMLNVGYGKDGIKPFVVMPRHQGRTAAMYMLDELERTGYFDTDKASTFSVLDKLDHQFYHNKNWKEALEVFMDKHDRIKKPVIENAIFNDPATIVFWKDGTKTVVKVREGDKFDEEKGLAMAICKKVLGNADGEYWIENFKKWLPEESEAKKLYEVGKLVSKAMNESMRRATEAMKNLEQALDGIAVVKRCGNCAFENLWPGDEPCRSCTGRPYPSNFKPKGSEPLKPCEECKHSDVHEFNEPCRSCSGNSKFEEKEIEDQRCKSCKHRKLDIKVEPCKSCVILRSKFEPLKDAK